MKNHYLTILRAQETDLDSFREASQRLSLLIAAEIGSQLSEIPRRVVTPLGVTQGSILKDRVILIPILRAGLALLPAFLTLFPNAPVGFFGIRRDDETATPHLYYENLPPFRPTDQILLLDPMLATGGSAKLALGRLEHKGVDLSQSTLVTILAAPEGVQTIKKRFPQVKVYTAALDEKLNQQQYIVPGLGDFGDRYFGNSCR